MVKKEIVVGIPSVTHVESMCDSCLAGKHIRHSFPTKVVFRVTKSLELLHGDLYRLYDPVAGKVMVSKNVIFDWKKAWDWTSTTTKEDCEPSILKLLHEGEIEEGNNQGYDHEQEAMNHEEEDCNAN